MRLGMIGSDLLHALEYASIINARPGPDFPKIAVDHSAAVGGMAAPTISSGSWDPELPSADEVRADPAFADAHVVAWWGPDLDVARHWAQRTGAPQVVARPEDLIGHVDAVLVCTWHGRDHAALAAPFLDAGLPTFVDKPFTESVRDARRLIELAEERDTVLFTSSPWKWSPAITNLRGRSNELGELRTCVASGPFIGGPFFYVTHMVEVGQLLLGTGAASVTATETKAGRAITVTWSSGEVLLVNAMTATASIRHVVLYGERGYLEADVNERQKDAGMVEMLAAFLRSVRDGKPPLPYAYPLEATAVMAAAQRSVEAEGARIELSAVLRQDNLSDNP